jgi:hypothetical protein
MGFAVSTATPTLPAKVFVQTHQALYRSADPFMPILVCSATVASVPLAIVLFSEGDVGQGVWAAAVGVGFVVVIAITRLGNKPINKAVAKWNSENPPQNWALQRVRFNRFHAYRTVVAVASFLAVVGIGVALTSTTTTIKVWATAALIFAGLAAGGLVFMYAVVTRATLTLSGSSYTATHQATARTASPYMTGITVVGTVTAVALLAALWRDGQSVAAGFVAAAVVAALGVIAISVSLSVPMNRQIAKWDIENPPADWARVRTRWMHVHLSRTVTSVCGFVLIATGVLSLA